MMDEEDVIIEQTVAAIQRNDPTFARRSFSRRRSIPAVGGVDEAVDMTDNAAIAQCAAAFQQRFSQTQGHSHRSASYRRQSLGNGIDNQTTSRKRPSQNSIDNFTDPRYSDEEDEKYSTTAQSTAEMDDEEYSARSFQSATDNDERPRKRLSHSSATSMSSIGPLDPDRPRRDHRRRAAIRVPNFETEASIAQQRRLELLKKDRYETRRVKVNDGRHHTRRSLSYTTGLQIRSIIPSSLPEEAEPEEANDLMRLSRSRYERRVLSLPDPNAVRRLSQSSLNRDADFSDGHNCQSGLSATLIAASEAARASIGGRLSTSSFANRCSMMPSIGDHLEDIHAFDEDIEEEGELAGSSFNVPPSIVCHEIPPFENPSMHNNMDSVNSLPLTGDSNTFQRTRPRRRMALHSSIESSMLMNETSMNPLSDVAAMESQRLQELRSNDSFIRNQYDFSQQCAHGNNLHQRRQGFAGFSGSLTEGGRSLYSSERRHSLSSLNDSTNSIGLSGLLQGLHTTTNEHESFPRDLHPRQEQAVRTHNGALFHDPIAAAAALVNENVLAAQSLNQTAENILAHHASTTMMHHEDMPRNAPIPNEPEGFQSREHCKQDSSMNSNDDASSTSDSFDEKKTSVFAREISTPQEESAMRCIQKAVELDDPKVRTFVKNIRMSPRLILNNPNNSDDVALHLAVRRGSLMAMETILNVDVDSCLIRNSLGQVPLHIAAECGNFAAVTSICNRCPASARVQCEEGCLPLHEAVSSGADKQDAPQITAILLSSFPEGANVTTDEGLLPIHLAAMSGFSAGLRTIFAYKFETLNSRESTEMMLPLDFAVDGLNSQKGDAPDAELLSVAHKQPSSSEKESDSNDFESCIEILLVSTLYNRLVTYPRDENSGVAFLPLHGALAARPLHRTWKCLLSLYGEKHLGDTDEFGRNIVHYLCSRIEDDGNSLSMLKEVHQVKPDLFAQVDGLGFIPLHLCLLNKKPPSFEIVKTVVDYNPSAATVEARGESIRGFFPFQIAAISGCDEDVILYLLRNHPVGVQ